MCPAGAGGARGTVRLFRPARTRVTLRPACAWLTLCVKSSIMQAILGLHLFLSKYLIASGQVPMSSASLSMALAHRSVSANTPGGVRRTLEAMTTALCNKHAHSCYRQGFVMGTALFRKCLIEGQKDCTKLERPCQNRHAEPVFRIKAERGHG